MKQKEESLLEAIITAIGVLVVFAVSFFGIAMIIGLFLKIILDVAGIN